MFINSVTANTADGEASAPFTFPTRSVIAGQDNVLTVLQDHMGNDEGPFGNIEGPNRECSSRVQYSLTYKDDFATQKNRLVVFADSSSLGGGRKVLDLEGPLRKARRSPRVRPFILSASYYGLIPLFIVASPTEFVASSTKAASTADARGGISLPSPSPTGHLVRFPTACSMTR